MQMDVKKLKADEHKIQQPRRMEEEYRRMSHDLEEMRRSYQQHQVTTTSSAQHHQQPINSPAMRTKATAAPPFVLTQSPDDGGSEDF